MRARRVATRLGRAPVVVAIGAALAILPFSPCVLRLVLGVPCPACGLTRAGLALARLDLASAVRFQPLSPLLLLLAAAAVPVAAFAGEATWRRFVTAATGAAGVALWVVWLLRFAGLFGGPVP